MLSLIQLQIMRGLAQDKTLAQIGEEYFLSQPSISKLLRLAESEAGVALVERRGRRLCLTPAGQEVARAGQRVTAQLHELEHLLQGFQAGTTGTLRLLATNTPGNYVLPSIIGEFLRGRPAARLVLRVVAAETLVSTLLEESYDFAVGTQQAFPDSVQVEPLYDDHITFFAAPHSPLAQQPRLTWEDLHRHTLVGPFTQPYWALFFDQLAARGLTLGPHIDLRALEGLKRLVENSTSVGVLFGAALEREFRDGRLLPLDLAEAAHTQPFCLLRREGGSLSPLARRFRSFLHERLPPTHS